MFKRPFVCLCTVISVCILNQTCLIEWHHKLWKPVWRSRKCPMCMLRKHTMDFLNEVRKEAVCIKVQSMCLPYYHPLKWPSFTRWRQSILLKALNCNLLISNSSMALHKGSCLHWKWLSKGPKPECAAEVHVASVSCSSKQISVD